MHAIELNRRKIISNQRKHDEYHDCNVQSTFDLFCGKGRISLSQQKCMFIRILLHFDLIENDRMWCVHRFHRFDQASVNCSVWLRRKLFCLELQVFILLIWMIHLLTLRLYSYCDYTTNGKNTQDPIQIPWFYRLSSNVN